MFHLFFFLSRFPPFLLGAGSQPRTCLRVQRRCVASREGLFFGVWLTDEAGAEVAQKLESKRDPALEEEVITWIKAKVGDRCRWTCISDCCLLQTGEDAHPLAEKLNDGLVLCKLANALKPGLVKAGPAKMPFHKMENINRFIEAAQKLGVKEQDVFATVDLYEAKNIVKVIDTLIALKRVTGN